MCSLASLSSPQESSPLPTTMPQGPRQVLDSRTARERNAARSKTSLPGMIQLIIMIMAMVATSRMISTVSISTARAFSTTAIVGFSTSRIAKTVPTRKRIRGSKERFPPSITWNGLTTTTTVQGSASDDSEQSDTEPSLVPGTSAGPTAFETLFQSTLSRAYSTTATLESIKRDPSNEDSTATKSEVSKTVESILNATVIESDSDATASSSSSKERIASNVDSLVESTIATASQSKYAQRTQTQKQKQTQEHHSKKSQASARYEFPFATSYKSHPALNNVALAHALWASVLRPNCDVVIDATCGNGNDSIVLGEILFGRNDNEEQEQGGELLCVDVQSLACERTTKALKEVLPSSVTVVGPNDENDTDLDSYQQLARVLNASHEQLPRPLNPEAQVGLVVYNLGWLPGVESVDGKDCVTTMDSTMTSLVDATFLLRVGGMLSVVTYPQTGPDEDKAVKLFVTCLALLSSRTRTWQEEVQAFLSCSDNNPAIADSVAAAMETVVSRGDQTWRVSQHDKLGMDRPPILFTATRIK